MNTQLLPFPAVGFMVVERGSRAVIDLTRCASKLDDSTKVMVAAVRELVAQQHDLVGDDSPILNYWFQPSSASFPLEGQAHSPEAIDAVEAQLAAFGNVFPYSTCDSSSAESGTRGVGAVVHVGEPLIEGGKATVDVAMFRGNVCGTAGDVNLKKVNGEWLVDGETGPWWIS